MKNPTTILHFDLTFEVGFYNPTYRFPAFDFDLNSNHNYDQLLYFLEGIFYLMADIFNKETETELLKKVTPYLNKGRPGDYEHTLRVVEYGKQILEKEDGIPGIVIPCLYLHDIGWSLVDYDDFLNAASPDKMHKSDSVELHMKMGAAKAKEILEELGYDSEGIQRITNIIKVHDDQEALLALKDPSAVVLFEADQLDKVGPESSKRFKRVFADAESELDLEATKTYMENAVKKWFHTETAKAMARAFLEESPIADNLAAYNRKH